MPNQNLSERWVSLQHRIETASDAAGRAVDDVGLLAVSKKQPAAMIRTAAGLGQRAFGENYVDEALEKMAELGDCELEWHFIGPIQSNKTRAIAEHFDWVQSVDRAKVARRLGQQRPNGRPALNVLIQVNLDDETRKAGCAPSDLDALADLVADQSRLNLRGLMAIPAPRTERREQQAVFEQLRSLFDQLKARYPGVDTLSAGMSGDLEAAVAAGSTLVRIGTDLFGPRG